MASRTKRRTEWHQKNGIWTRTLGERGMRIRLFQKRRDGSFYRDMWIPGVGKSRQCLHTNQREVAVRIGRELLAKLYQNEPVVLTGPITLGELFHRYQNEAATFLDNEESTRKASITRAKILISVLGEHRDVRSLCENDVLRYTHRRLAGGIPYNDKVTKPVRARSVQSDLDVLYWALTWATRLRVSGYKRWLDFHPLAGVRYIREKNPKRPITTWERYQQARQTARELVAQAEAKRTDAKTPEGRAAADADREKWIHTELALVLLEATGRRAGAIRQLRWEDINFTTAEITWRAATDKKGQEWVIPIPESLLGELRAFRRKLGAVAGWVFPAEKNAATPIRRDVFSRWILMLERHAKLPKLDGGLLHTYRRKWATERKNLSLKDVAAVGGWRDVGTLLSCYQQADRQTMLAVMSEPRKVTAATIVGG